MGPRDSPTKLEIELDINSRIGNMFFKGYDMLKENSMFKKIPITDFEKS